jgi:tetrahydromethanopterin S-methyltransferase subunit G
MSTTTEIEKKSLEAHVELCAERYKSLETRLDKVNERIDDLDRKIDAKINKMESMLEKIVDKLDEVQGDRNKQLIKWATTVIGVLTTSLAAIVWYMLTK